MINQSLHIELTSRCTLECPACPRTIWKDILKYPVAKTDLDITHLDTFLNCNEGKQINHFVLCGDYGDPIYYPKLFDFIRHFRSTKTFSIHTNGSYQTEKFWNTLSKLLCPDDNIIFGIDGLEDTNHLYRKNSNWASIMLGLDIMSQGSAKIYWQTIIFNFNYKILDNIQKFAESKNASFFTIMSHRFGDDSLMPPEEYIETHYLYNEEYNTKNVLTIVPQCEKERVITSDGYCLPCDWIRNPKTFYKSELWKQKSRWIEKLKLDNTTLDQAMIVVKDWARYVQQSGTSHPDKVNVICKMKCRAGCPSPNKLNE